MLSVQVSYLNLFQYVSKCLEFYGIPPNSTYIYTFSFRTVQQQRLAAIQAANTNAGSGSSTQSNVASNMKTNRIKTFEDSEK